MLQLLQKTDHNHKQEDTIRHKSIYPKKQRAFAVLYLPVTSLLRTLSIKEVLFYTKKKIKDSISDPKQLTCIAIDYWQYQNSSQLNFLETLFSQSDISVVPVGPSVCEILKISDTEKKIRIFLKSLLNIGVCSVEGGSEENCLEIAASEKFLLRPSFAINLNQGFHELLAKKISLVEALSRTSNRVETITVFPDKRFSNFDNDILKLRSIQKYQKTLRECRNLAKSIPYLRAPISAFGNISPEELAINEVNDFGHFAINHETAIALGLEQLDQRYRSLFL